MSPIDEKPSRNEDEYHMKRDAELIREQRARLDAERAKRELASHLGKCPRCGRDLVEREYHHIKADSCPSCHGMWLDQAEIEMLEHVDRNEVRTFIRHLFGLS